MALEKSPNKEHPLWDFTNPTDLILVVEDCEFHVHRVMMSRHSPVFKVMLESEYFTEKDQKVIPLPNKRAEDMQELLNFIYPFGHQITESSNIESLLALAREYQISKIKSLCEAFLLRKVPSIEQVIMAEEYDLRQLREKCLKQLSEKALHSVQEHPRFHEISERNRLHILEQQVKKLQTYCKKISQISLASDVRFLPVMTTIQCGHKPRSCNNPHFICNLCKASVLRSFVKEESWKLGLEIGGEKSTW